MLNITKENFEKEVLKSDKKVVVDFNADWCGPCRMLKPVLEELSSEMKDYKFVSINVDDEDDLSSEYNISSIPCLIIFENGKEVTRSIGFKSKDELNNLLGGNWCMTLL